MTRFALTSSNSPPRIHFADFCLSFIKRETPEMPDSASPESVDTGGGGGHSSTSARVLACIQCQQRKVKCDRKFPCSRCVKGDISCVPGTAIGKQRKKRFAERDLLDRLRRYEQLMTEHNVPYEPMHGNSSQQRQLPTAPQSETLTRDSPSESKAESPFATRYVHSSAVVNPIALTRVTRDLWTAINTVVCCLPSFHDIALTRIRHALNAPTRTVKTATPRTTASVSLPKTYATPSSSKYGTLRHRRMCYLVWVTRRASN